MDSSTKTLIHGLTQAELVAACEAAGEKAFRAKQIWRWLYVQRATEWEALKNIPAALRSALSSKYSIVPGTRLAVEGAAGETRKILVGLGDGEAVEEVLIPAGDRRTVCVSSQVGCRFGCCFCATGQCGYKRNLEAGEMVGQLLLATSEYGARPSNVVFMGMGEPFDNYDAVLKAVRIINDGEGLAIGARHITISTCGIVPGIERLAGEGIQIELSVSVHAADDALRSRLMPVNRKYPIEALVAACARYAERTNRIVTFEYTLVRDVNDSAVHARELATLMRRLPCRANLIPLSPVAGYAGAPPLPETTDAFMGILSKAGLNVTLRVSKGGGINAACGQLRLRQGNPAHIGGKVFDPSRPTGDPQDHAVGREGLSTRNLPAARGQEENGGRQMGGER